MEGKGQGLNLHITNIFQIYRPRLAHSIRVILLALLSCLSSKYCCCDESPSTLLVTLLYRSVCSFNLFLYFTRKPLYFLLSSSSYWNKNRINKCLHFILQGLFILYEKTDHKRRRSSRLRRIFTVAFLLFLPLRGALNPAGPIYPNPAGQS